MCAKAWISAHDGDKETKGFGSAKIVTQKYGREEVESVVSPRNEKFADSKIGTKVVILEVGEEIGLSQGMNFLSREDMPMLSQSS